MIHKIKDAEKINQIIRTAKKIHSKDYVLFYEDKNTTQSEIVVIVPKKKFKRAVLRNRIRRQITAILIQTKILDNLKKHYSLIFMVKEPYDTENFLQNKQNITKLFQKLGG